MTKEFKYEEKTVDLALQKGLKDLKLSEDMVKIEVLEMGSGGIFGLFKKNAVVKLTPLVENYKKEEKKEKKVVKEKVEIKKDIKKEEKQVVKEEKEEKEVREDKEKKEDRIVKNKDSIVNYIEKIVKSMGYKDAKVVFSENGNKHYTLDIQTNEDTSLLIGKRGITLNGLQFLANNYAKKYTKYFFRIVVDCENYREYRVKTLEDLALNLAKKSKKLGKSIELEPMTSAERKIIHNALSEITNVETESRGEEPHRYLVITAK